VNFTVATSDRFKDKATGENKEITEWHRINFFGRQAEVVAQLLRKGSQVYVEGSLRTRRWSDKDGVEKSATEIRGDNFQVLGRNPNRQSNEPQGGSDGSSGGQYQGQNPRRPQASNRGAASQGRPQFDSDQDDDIPY
jgi:single-strand DNA-binding protein